MTAHAIAEALGKAERDGKGWKSLCPIHDDHRPSLSLRDEGGKVLAHCHVCGKDGQADLIDELKRRGLWPESPKQKPARKTDIVATYDYRNENGALRYQVVRKKPKAFVQRRPPNENDKAEDIKGGWVWSMKGVELLPYRLPELLATPKNAVVFVAEGEKDVDALRGIGAVATCNSGGGGKWPVAISCWLADRDVVILPDDDDVGRKHARDVAAKLKGVAAKVRALVLPGGGKDPADWIAAGNTLEELTLLVDEAAEDATTLGDAVVEEPVPLGYSRDERFIFLDPVRRIVVAYTAGQLTSTGMLLALAPLDYWQRRFPDPRKPFDAIGASDTLIKACRKAGPFDMAKVRGRGVWLDKGNIVVNLGGRVPDPRYVCFEPLPVADTGEVDVKRLLRLLQTFRWRNPNDALLTLGWMAIAPVCGVLDWRPHIWIHGPTQTGKTTLVQLLKAMTAPLSLSVDGGSTEAGIRQALGPDSLPIIVDEFESDQSLERIRGVLRLARSASSGEDALLRGTPEGRVLRFCLRTTFAYASINPVGMEGADKSRTVMLELTPHNNSSDTAALIAKELAHFEGQTGAWCRMMIARAHLLPPTIMVIEPFINAGERRHRQNMATLLPGAAVAIEGRIPTEEEAKSIAEIARGTVEAHAEEFQRDDGRECLEYLFAHQVQTAHGPTADPSLFGEPRSPRPHPLN